MKPEFPFHGELLRGHGWVGGGLLLPIFCVQCERDQSYLLHLCLE